MEEKTFHELIKTLPETHQQNRVKMANACREVLKQCFPHQDGISVGINVIVAVSAVYVSVVVSDENTNKSKFYAIDF